MPKYTIVYKPNSMSDRANLETDVEADAFVNWNKFIRFVRSQKHVLTISSADVLQIQEAPSAADTSWYTAEELAVQTVDDLREIITEELMIPVPNRIKAKQDLIQFILENNPNEVTGSSDKREGGA